MSVLDKGTTAMLPRRYANMEVCRAMYYMKNWNVSPNELKEAFDRHVLKHYQETCLYTDDSKIEQRVGYTCIGEQ